MALHRLTSITMGVPNVGEIAAYYEEFGLVPDGDGWLASRERGRQLRIVPAPTRRLVELRVGVDDADDLERAAASLARMGIRADRGPGSISAVEKATETRAYLEVAGRFEQCAVPATAYNGPRPLRALRRARAGCPAYRGSHAAQARPRRPRLHRLPSHPEVLHRRAGLQDQRLHQGRGRVHALLGRPPQPPGASRPGVVPAPHLLTGPARRHRRGRPWRPAHARGSPRPARLGLGRHYGGSNFFWYPKDPAGNLSEYYSDMDCIIGDQLWTPEELVGAQGLYAWAPPPPPSFLHREELAVMMTGAHSRS